MTPFTPWALFFNEYSEFLHDLEHGLGRTTTTADDAIFATCRVSMYMAEYTSAMSRLCGTGLPASASPSFWLADALFDTAVAAAQIMHIHVNRMHGALAQYHARARHRRSVAP